MWYIYILLVLFNTPDSETHNPSSPGPKVNMFENLYHPQIIFKEEKKIARPLTYFNSITLNDKLPFQLYYYCISIKKKLVLMTYV